MKRILESIISVTDEETKKWFDMYVSTICNIYSVEDNKNLGELFLKFQDIMSSLSLVYQIYFLIYLSNDLVKPKEERELFPNIHKKIMEKFKEEYINSVDNLSEVISKKRADINRKLKMEGYNNET